MLGAIYKLWPASGFPLAGQVVLVVPGNLVMPSVSSARGGGNARGGGARLGAARRLLSLELQVGGEAQWVGAVFFHRFLVTSGKIGVVFIAGARGVVDVI